MKYHDLDDIDETTHAFVSISQIDDLITQVVQPVIKRAKKDREFAHELE